MTSIIRYSKKEFNDIRTNLDRILSSDIMEIIRSISSKSKYYNKKSFILIFQKI